MNAVDAWNLGYDAFLDGKSLNDMPDTLSEGADDNETVLKECWESGWYKGKGESERQANWGSSAEEEVDE